VTQFHIHQEFLCFVSTGQKVFIVADDVIELLEKFRITLENEVELLTGDDALKLVHHFSQIIHEAVEAALQREDGR
jgi:hypothetical protein